MVVFERPVGAVADTKELEYIAALHQTSPVVRRNGSVNAQDIQLYLLSRFGIDVTMKQVCETILQGMGGGADDGEVLDLMEIAAILLIPVLLKAATAATEAQSSQQERIGTPLSENSAEYNTQAASDRAVPDKDNSSQPPNNLIDFVRQMILFDVMGQPSLETPSDTPDGVAAPLLTMELLQKIFRTYGEEELAADEALLQDMIDHVVNVGGVSSTSVDAYIDADADADDAGTEAADKPTSPDGPSTSTPPLLRFDTITFARALTNDVTLFNVHNENRPSNVYMDVFDGPPGTPPMMSPTRDNGMTHNDNNIATVNSNSNEDRKELGKDGRLDAGVMHEVGRRYTAPSIDSTAGTYRSKTLLVSLWAGTLFVYFTAIRPNMPSTSDNTCDEDLGTNYIVGGGWSDNWGIMACETIWSIFIWLSTFITLCLTGMVFIGCGSCGNTDSTKHPWAPLWAFIFVLLAIAVPGSQNDTDDSESEPYLITEDESGLAFNASNANVDNDDDENETGLVYLRVVASMLGIVATLLHLLHLIYLCSPEGSALKEKLGRHAMQDEIDLKTAQGYKLAQMVKNACRIHEREDRSSVLRTCFGHGIYEYSKSVERDIEKAGGFLWGWKRIWSKDVLRKEGIWYSARLIASNISQYIVTLYILLSGIYVLQYVHENFEQESMKEDMRNRVTKVLNRNLQGEDVYAFAANFSSVVGGFLGSLNSSGAIDLNCQGLFGTGWEAYAQLCPGFLDCERNYTSESVCALVDLQNEGVDGYRQMNLLDASGLDANVILGQVSAAMEEAVNSSVDSLYPEETYMITIPILFGTIAALLASASLALGYLPSVSATYIKLRTGVIPTLTDDLLHRYRAAPDTVTLLTGSLFWGCLFASILVGIVVALVIFLFIWQGSVYIAQRIVAVFIGILVVALIRIGIFCVGRRRYFKAFYRTKPAAANIFFLAMEWANFALSVGFVFVRMIKLLIATSFCIGRIDTPFLARGMGEIGPVELDAFPTIHLRDILSHEAHRHPYIEMLGSMYLMKLHYGKRFGTNCGSCWRLIFIYALFPWLHKYRVFSDDGSCDANDNDRLDCDEVRSCMTDRVKLPGASFMFSGKRRPVVSRDVCRDEKDETILELEKEIQRLRRRLEQGGVKDDGVL